MKTVTAKLGNMRKAVDWTVYPPSASGTVVIQSDHRIAQFDPVSGKGWLSAHKGSGAYFPHLFAALGATVITVPADVIAAAVAAQPQSGDEVGPGVTIA